MAQSLANLHIHLIFSTKSRAEFIDDEIRPELHAYLGRALENMKCPSIAMNSVEDHIHLLFRLGRTATIARTVEEVKKSSSKWIKTKDDRYSEFAWQSGYGAFSVSESNKAQVIRYIQNQREHHRKRSYQQEYREFLEKNNIEFDERYVWD